MRLLPEDPDIGWGPYAFLVYLGFVFMGAAFADAGTTPWIASCVAIVVFLPMYFVAYWLHGWRRLALATAMALLMFPLATVNASASSFAIYGAYFAGSGPRRAIHGVLAVAWIGLLLLVCTLTVQPIIYFWLPGGLGVLGIGLIGVQNVTRSAQIAELKLARAEIDALARIAERERIARDLHDLLGHSLSIIALKSELAQRVADDDPERAKQELGDVQTVAREALAEVRVAVRGYRVGSGAGLRFELDNAERALEAAGVRLVCETDPAIIAPLLDATREGALALALREAVTNVVRHAQARTCEITFFVDGRHYGLSIADDGQGAQGRPGHGLWSMRARIESLGGRFERMRGAGTRWRLAFVRHDPDPETTYDSSLHEEAVG
jgi:two-component system sensor histidine kinase DesK